MYGYATHFRNAISFRATLYSAPYSVWSLISLCFLLQGTVIIDIPFSKCFLLQGNCVLGAAQCLIIDTPFSIYFLRQGNCVLGAAQSLIIDIPFLKCFLLQGEILPMGISTSQLAAKDFRAKYPDDVVQDNLPGQLWFGAEVS